MKNKAYSLIIVLALIASAGLACSQTDYGESDTGFASVDFTEKTIETGKQYSFSTPAESCGPDAGCAAVLWQGTLDDETYLAIAVNDSHDDKNFYLKIYFPYTSSFEAGNPVNIIREYNDYTIKVYTNNKIYSTPENGSTGQLDITVTRDASNDNKYTVLFNKSITLTDPESLTVASNGDKIIAQKY